jgi:hypothetical protein
MLYLSPSASEESLDEFFKGTTKVSGLCAHLIERTRTHARHDPCQTQK